METGGIGQDGRTVLKLVAVAFNLEPACVTSPCQKMEDQIALPMAICMQYQPTKKEYQLKKKIKTVMMTRVLPQQIHQVTVVYV